jgi:hypothetical protein
VTDDQTPTPLRGYFAAAYWVPQTKAALKRFRALGPADGVEEFGNPDQYRNGIVVLFSYYDELFRRSARTRESWWLPHVQQLERTFGLPADIRATLGVPDPPGDEG